MTSNRINLMIVILSMVWVGGSFADQGLIESEKAKFEQAVRTAFQEQNPEKLAALIWPRDRPKPATSYDIGGPLRHLFNAKAIRHVGVDKITAESKQEYMRSTYKDGIESGLVSEPEYDVTVVADKWKSNKPYVFKFPGIIKEGRLWVLVPVPKGRATNAPKGLTRERRDVNESGKRETQETR